MADGQRAVLEAFVELTDVLVTDLDIDAYLRRVTVRTRELLDVPAVALLLTGDDGALDVTASSGELADLVAQYEAMLEEGPAVDAVRLNAPVKCLELSAAVTHWPGFAEVAVEAGVVAVHAQPCRRGDDVLGALTMYSTHADTLSRADTELGRAMANVASLGVTVRWGRELAVLADQLQTALHSRVIIEQAKGVLAERMTIPVGEAFELLRRHARNTNAKLHAVASAVVSGTLTPPRVN